MNLRTNKVFRYLINSDKRIVSMRGGTRSGKTYNILIFLIYYALQKKGLTITIARQTLPALKSSAMRDFFEILENLGLYDVTHHNKTRNEYILNGNMFEFIAVKESQRVRGRKRSILYLNEANECDIEAWRQLSFRTTDFIILDYNPSDAYSWIYDQVETREDCECITTTYRDNPFLERSIINEIELLQDADPDYWKVYGLGERAILGNQIYTHWKICSSIPNGRRIYGLDFGYNNPTALIEVTEKDVELYYRELLYQTKLTTPDLIEILKGFPELQGSQIVADSAEPKTIEDLNRAGFWITPANKTVKDGIKLVKSRPMRIYRESSNLITELKAYSWKKDKFGNLIDEPIKFKDHLLDGGRYAVYELIEGEHLQSDTYFGTAGSYSKYF